MATRPAKRQRRSNNAPSGDDDALDESTGLPLRSSRPTRNGPSDRDDATTSSALSPQKGQGRTRLSGPVSSMSQSPSSSPRKTRKTSEQAFETKNNKSLYSFFSKATEEQRWQRRNESTKEDVLDDDITDDIIDDDDSLEDSMSRSSDGKAVRPIPVPASKLVAESKNRTSRASTPSFSQKFAKASSLSEKASHDPPKPGSGPDESTGHRPWADRFGPSSIEELAIHKKKVADVQKWLEDVVKGRSAQVRIIFRGFLSFGSDIFIENPCSEGPGWKRQINYSITRRKSTEYRDHDMAESLRI